MKGLRRRKHGEVTGVVMLFIRRRVEGGLGGGDIDTEGWGEGGLGGDGIDTDEE